jgi:nucleoside 2-deoxyribosyltransferase
MEIGYAIAKGKPFTLALKTGIKTVSIVEMANQLIEFETTEDLCEKLKKVF